MSNFDIANLALKSVCPSNEMLYDDKGMPSVMVKVPKMTWAELGIGTSTEVFPAWKVKGQEIDAIYYSKYPNIKNNNRGYSLPGEEPGHTLTLAQAQSYCTNKGDGWHEITRLEWIAIALWCLKNGTLPKGNNLYGKDHSESNYKAIPAAHDGEGRITRTLVGTGPLSWSHNGEADGIWDLNGNVYEWTPGVRTVYGELQVMTSDGVTFDNACADPECIDSASSALWRAIDGTTGELIVPNGSGTTSNSLKADWVGGVWKWITGTISNQEDNYHGNTFESCIVDTNVCEAAKYKLQALGFLKPDGTTSAGGDYIYMNNGNAERSFFCGGYWSRSSYAGVFDASGDNSRSSAYASIGFRSAFVELPTA